MLMPWQVLCEGCVRGMDEHLILPGQAQLKTLEQMRHLIQVLKDDSDE